MNNLEMFKRQGRTIAKKLFPIPNNLCKCGNPLSDIHHIDSNTHNNSPDNIMFLCHKCHAQIERQNRKVGSHTKLSQSDIDNIKNPNIKISTLAKELNLHPAYLRRIRNGQKNPIPYSPPTIPDNWTPPRTSDNKQIRFQKHALSPEQVKELRQIMFMPRNIAQNFANKFNVSISTIYKAKNAHAGYSHPIFNQ